LKKTIDLNITTKDALIVTDIQIDFLPGGALPIAEGDLVIPVLNDYIKMFEQANAKIVASRDWHPPNHVSFTTQGGPWLPHCIQNSEGAKFSPNLKLPAKTVIVSKATDPYKEAYSVFDGIELVKRFKDEGVSRIFIGGFAADYCVLNSVIDARKMGFETYVLMDATKGINVKAGDVDRAFETMTHNGAKLVSLSDFPEPEPLVGEESPIDVSVDKPLEKLDEKKKARMRAKGAHDRIRRERA